MTKKSVFISLFLITVGIIVGALLVSSSTNGVAPGLAGGSDDIKLGAASAPVQGNVDLKAASNAFVAVSKAVTPTVVSIVVTTSGKKSQPDMPQDFWHWFGPDQRNPEQRKSQGGGSGVIVTPDGYIVTNNHVVDDADQDGIEVRMYNDKTRYKGKLVGTDPTTDLAVIKIDQKNLPVAALGNSDNVQVGEWVLAVGNPLNLTSTVTAGIVSAIGRNIGIIGDNYGIENFIQTDAAINPGNSGGALVNINGEVVGINTAIASTNMRYQGYGFAVPVNIMKTVATDLIQNGKVRRGYIGVRIKRVDETLASAMGLGKARGVLIDRVEKDGAGEAAGLKDGDVVLSIDGKEVNEANELQSQIALRHPGDVVTLKIFRDGKTIDRKVTLKPRGDSKPVVEASDRRESEGEGDDLKSPTVNLSSLGMSVRPLTAEEKRQADVDNGALVSEVTPYGEAFDQGLQQRDIIVEADRKAVSSPSDLRRILQTKKAGEALLLRVKRQEIMTYIAVQIPK